LPWRRRIRQPFRLPAIDSCRKRRSPEIPRIAMNCNRRHFLERSCQLVVAGAGGAWFTSLLSGCAPVRSLQAEVNGDMLTLDSSQLPADGFVTVNAAGLPAPVYVGRNENQSYSAVLMLCTHKACLLEPAGRYLTCPCHGS